MNFFFFSIFFLINFSTDAMNLFDEKMPKSQDYLEDWEYISDQVMGGVSVGKVEILNDNKLFLRLSGDVSTKNNGGFIQVRKKLELNDKSFTGIKMKVRGNSEDYFVHIRTSKLIFPWQFYSAKFKAGKSWSEIIINFNEFSKSNFYQPASFSPLDIESIAFVAFGKDFNARLEIEEAKLF